MDIQLCIATLNALDTALDILRDSDKREITPQFDFIYPNNSNKIMTVSVNVKIKERQGGVNA